VRNEANFIRRFVKARAITPCAESLQHSDLPGAQFDVGNGRKARVENALKIENAVYVFRFQPRCSRILAQIELRPFRLQPVGQRLWESEAMLLSTLKQRRVLE